jgi:hypothetical protein
MGLAEQFVVSLFCLRFHDDLLAVEISLEVAFNVANAIGLRLGLTAGRSADEGNGMRHQLRHSTATGTATRFRYSRRERIFSPLESQFDHCDPVFGVN